MKNKFLPEKTSLTLKTLIVMISLSLAGIFISTAFFLYLIAVLLLFPLYYIILLSLYGAATDEDEMIYAKTKDGWKLALHRYTPETAGGKFPVVLLHGIFVNRYSVDLTGKLSLANYLRENGYEVYLPDLRAKGMSVYERNSRAPEYSYDDLVNFDAPAILKEVLKISGAKKLHWIGHSMGGMIGYSLAAKPELSKNIASMISLAAPGKSDFIRTAPSASLMKFMQYTKFLNLKFVSKIMIPFVGILDIPPENFVYSRKNLSLKTIRMLYMNAVENTSPLLIKQLLDWIKSGKEYSLDGKTNYSSNFKKIKIPILFLSGIRDHIAIPESVAFAYKNIASKKKKYILFGKESKNTGDYCHMGLVVGDNTRDEVFPEVLRWIRTTE